MSFYQYLIIKSINLISKSKSFYFKYNACYNALNTTQNKALELISSTSDREITLVLTHKDSHSCGYDEEEIGEQWLVVVETVQEEGTPSDRTPSVTWKSFLNNIDYLSIFILNMNE